MIVGVLPLLLALVVVVVVAWFVLVAVSMVLYDIIMRMYLILHAEARQGFRWRSMVRYGGWGCLIVRGSSISHCAASYAFFGLSNYFMASERARDDTERQKSTLW